MLKLKQDISIGGRQMSVASLSKNFAGAIKPIRNVRSSPDYARPNIFKLHLTSTLLLDNEVESARCNSATALV